MLTKFFEYYHKEFKHADELLELARGRIIPKSLAKIIYKKISGKCKIYEQRMNDNMTVVMVELMNYENHYQGTDVTYKREVIFLVKGKVGKNLNML